MITRLTDDLDNEQLLTAINAHLDHDSSYSHILGSMCTPPSSFIRQIAANYAHINLGDPGLFPSSAKIEQEYLELLAEYLHAPSGWDGTITSGGSEGNVVGCWAARNWGRKIKHIKNGVLLAPKSAHISFAKAADLLDINMELIPLNDDYRVNVDLLKEKITSKTIGIVGIAGSTSSGVCDDIKALNDLAQDFKLYLHIDAAYGGMIIPILKNLGLMTTTFDFELSNVSSVTIDAHKLLGSLIPSGTLLFRSHEFTSNIAKNITYLAGGSTRQLTITGTRPGNAVIASWALFKFGGIKYLTEIVQNVMKETQYLLKQLKRLDLQLPYEPELNIVSFYSKKVNTSDLVEQLRKKGWHLSNYYDWVRIVVMPHITTPIIDEFIETLQTLL